MKIKDVFKLVLCHIESGVAGPFYRKGDPEAGENEVMHAEWEEAQAYSLEESAAAVARLLSLSAPEGSEWRVQHREIPVEE